MEKVEIEVLQVLWDVMGFDGLLYLFSSLMVFTVYLVVAYNSFKLFRKTRLPGSKMIAYSFWFLVLLGLPSLVFTFLVDAEFDEILLSILFVTSTTLPLVTATYGYRKMVLALLKDCENRKVMRGDI